MADEKKMRQANNVYQSICSMLDSKELRYQRFDDDLVISFGMSGDDIPMDFLYLVNAEAQVITLVSPLPLKIPEDKRVEMAVAVACANDGLVNGSFDYDVGEGKLKFRTVAPYMESILGEELYFYMLCIASSSVDRYNDRFMMLAKGMIDLEKFIQMENEK